MSSQVFTVCKSVEIENPGGLDVGDWTYSTEQPDVRIAEYNMLVGDTLWLPSIEIDRTKIASMRDTVHGIYQAIDLYEILYQVKDAIPEMSNITIFIDHIVPVSDNVLNNIEAPLSMYQISAMTIPETNNITIPEIRSIPFIPPNIKIKVMIIVGIQL